MSDFNSKPYQYAPEPPPETADRLQATSSIIEWKTDRFVPLQEQTLVLKNPADINLFIKCSGKHCVMRPTTIIEGREIMDESDLKTGQLFCEAGNPILSQGALAKDDNSGIVRETVRSNFVFFEILKQATGRGKEIRRKIGSAIFEIGLIGRFFQSAGGVPEVDALLKSAVAELDAAEARWQKHLKSLPVPEVLPTVGDLAAIVAKMATALSGTKPKPKQP